MSTLVTELQLTKVGRVCVPVSDTDRSIDFYVNTLGFEKRELVVTHDVQGIGPVLEV